ncbi:SMI1/KNR4 family protein [Actinoallomurus iriomotensis]|uniref:SMI1/KNR4 family protein n=1 Tax=Actinoallomurus iriomotensis TaxID=478107 RepID=UPI002557802F|nr:SMI1/KNR4 family protein [Actinoallomurus iriomotensis]
MGLSQLIGRLYGDAEFAAPASDEEIDQIERRLGQAAPDELRELLRQTNGVRAEYGSGLVWSVQEIRRTRGFGRTPTSLSSTCRSTS